MIPFNHEIYLSNRYPGWEKDQVFTIENWLWDPINKVSPPWLMSSFLKIKRKFNRSLEIETLPVWAKRLHKYAENDLILGGVDRKMEEMHPTITLVWRPELTKLQPIKSRRMLLEEENQKNYVLSKLPMEWEETNLN
jgi:hypothetical protein